MGTPELKDWMDEIKTQQQDKRAQRNMQWIGWCNRKLINVANREENGLEK